MDPSAQTTTDHRKEESPLLLDKTSQNDEDIESGEVPQKKPYRKYLLLLSCLGLIGIVVTFYAVFGIHDNNQSCSSFSSGESYCVSADSNPNMTLMSLGFTETSEALCTNFTTKEYVTAMLKRNVQFDYLRAYIRHIPEQLLDAAESIDKMREENQVSGLCGTPILIQDNIDTAGIVTTGGTKAFQKARPPKNAPALQRLVGFGA